MHGRTDDVSSLRTQLIRLIEPLDSGFDLLQSDRLTGAGTPSGSTGQAGEVLVLAAVAAVAGVDQPGAALPAEDGTLQVVGVLAVLLPRDVVCPKNVLNTEPQLRADQRFVLPLVVDAPVGHYAHVVGIAEHVVYAADRERLCCQLPTRTGAQALGVQRLDNLADRPVTQRVLIKSPADERRPILVHDDVAVPDVIDELFAVEIAERCPVGRAASLRLGVHAFEYFHGEVVGVVLSDTCHDVVEQFPGWALIDRFSDRDELCTRAGNRGIDRHVVGPVACEPVNLVNDDVVDSLRLQLLEHLLELRTIRRLGALASVDVLTGQHAAELLHLLQAHVTLVRDGVALCLAVHRRLLLSTDAQIDDDTQQ